MRAVIVLCSLLISTAVFSSVGESCKKTLIYFDLGNTLVNTKDNPFQIGYMPGAKEYLEELREAGCTMGLIVNIIESFGTNYQEKVDRLKDFVDKRWIEPEPFPWSLFENIYVPHSNEDLKPKPILFRLVHLNAWVRGMHVFYQGETLKEIEAARKVGMTAHQVGSREDSFYLPFDEFPIKE